MSAASKGAERNYSRLWAGPSLSPPASLAVRILSPVLPHCWQISYRAVFLRFCCLMAGCLKPLEYKGRSIYRLRASALRRPRASLTETNWELAPLPHHPTPTQLESPCQKWNVCRDAQQRAWSDAIHQYCKNAIGSEYKISLLITHCMPFKYNRTNAATQKQVFLWQGGGGMHERYHNMILAYMCTLYPSSWYLGCWIERSKSKYVYAYYYTVIQSSSCWAGFWESEKKRKEAEEKEKKKGREEKYKIYVRLTLEKGFTGIFIFISMHFVLFFRYYWLLRRRPWMCQLRCHVNLYLATWWHRPLSV